jgi:hypothetical protein
VFPVRYKLSSYILFGINEPIKYLQDLHMVVVLLTETHLKPHERFFIRNYHTDRFTGEKTFPISM